MSDRLPIWLRPSPSGNLHWCLADPGYSTVARTACTPGGRGFETAWGWTADYPPLTRRCPKCTAALEESE